MNRSVPSSSQVELINISPLNPLISKCEIKVLYAGKNRNKSFISKEVANEMARSLPGTPIVGQYFLNAGDYGDHGEDELVIDEHGVRFVKDTVPYGFIPPNAKAWWRPYLDKDGVEREYLVTEGFLWTGRYPDCKRVIEKGNHQSMELDRSSLKGHWGKLKEEWANFENDNDEYFIINEAKFTALCILGENVEPCFEGGNITKSSNVIYSLNGDNFKDKMLDFIADLKDALNEYEGGNNMLDNKTGLEGTDENQVTNPEPETPETENTAAGEPEGDAGETDFIKKKKKDDDDEDDNSDDNGDDNSDDNDDDDNDDEDEKKKKKKKGEFSEDDEDEEFAKKKKKCGYALEEVVEYQELLVKFNELQGQFNQISTELNSIKPEYSKLKETQEKAEVKAKEEMIKSFYMLSSEDKKEVSDNIQNYSLDEIESKLSVLCVRKKVNFDLDNSSKNEENTETPITTFNIGDSADSTPAWLKAVDSRAKHKK